MAEQVKSAREMAEEDQMARDIYREAANIIIVSRSGGFSNFQEKFDQYVTDIEGELKRVKEVSLVAARIFFEKRPESD